MPDGYDDMSVPICFEAVKNLMKRLGKTVPDSDLRDMAVRLSEMRADQMSEPDFIKTAKELFVDRMEREADAKRAAKIINLEKIQTAQKVIGQDVPGMTPAQKVEAWLFGNAQRIGDSLNLSVQDSRAVMIADWFRDLRAVLKENGDYEVATSGVLDKEVYQELSNVQSGGGKPASDSEQAFRIAKGYSAILKSIFEKKQAFDPFLNAIEDYFHRATHDPQKIVDTSVAPEVSRANWVSKAMAAYGNKSFPELTGEAKIQAFENVYDQIATGRYDSQLSLDLDSGDLMGKMARQRTLIPNDWKSFYEYNQEFGRDNVHVSMERAIKSAAHDIAVIQKFGSMAADTYNGVMNELMKNGTREEIQNLKDNRPSLEGAFRSVVERGSPAGNGLLPTIQRGAMAWEQLTRSGAGWFRAVADLSNAATVVSDATGSNSVANIAELTASYFKNLAIAVKDPEAIQRAMEDVFLYSHSGLTNYIQEMGGTSSIFGDHPIGDSKLGKGLTWSVQLMSKLSGMDAHINAVEFSTASALSRDLGLLTEHPFSELAKETQGLLTRYGIGPTEWELISHGVESWEGKGIPTEAGRVDRMLNVNSLKSIPDEKLAQYMKDAGVWKGDSDPNKSALIRARTDLQTKVGTLFHQAAMAASATAGDAERFKMFGGTDPNSLGGLGWRLMMQFKSAILKNYDTMMRSVYSNPDMPNGDWSKVARSMVFTASLFAVGETMKSLITGKTPENPATPEFMTKMLANSGGGGILADTILSEFTRHSSAKDIAAGILKSAAGPTASTAADVLGVTGSTLQSLGNDGGKFPGKDIGNLVAQNVPFHNLFFTQAAFNYYYTRTLMEHFFDPGYGAKLDAATQKRGQSYLFLNPSEESNL